MKRPKPLCLLTTCQKPCGNAGCRAKFAFPKEGLPKYSLDEEVRDLWGSGRRFVGDNELKCKWCKKPFIAQLSIPSLWGNLRYCSRKCMFAGGVRTREQNDKRRRALRY